MNLSGMNMASLRKLNEFNILTYLNSKGKSSRHEIAREIGLTPASLTQITGRLIDAGILRECGVSSETGKGRKQILLEINPDWKYIISISIEVDVTFITITNILGEKLIQDSIPASKNLKPELFLYEVCDLTERLMKNFEKELRDKKKEEADYLGVSVGIPGSVRDGVSLGSRLWKEPVSVKSILEERLGLPVNLENNVNAFASAELAYGAGKSYGELLLIKWGPGVGSTEIRGGDAHKFGIKPVEMGHLIVNKDGRTCSCGKRGCLETEISFDAVNARLKESGCPEILSQEDFASYYEMHINKGDKASEILARAVDIFSMCIVNTRTLLSPDKVVFYGAMLKSERVRYDIIKSCIALDPGIEKSIFIYSRLSDREEFIGPAADLVMKRIYSEI